MHLQSLIPLRLAATNDIRDGMTYLSPGSNHYMNVYGDASWEIAGRESHTDAERGMGTSMTLFLFHACIYPKK